MVSKIWNSPSARNVGKLFSANVIAQVIGILIYPILTRIYTPDDFGLMGLFASLAGILVIISTANYQEAIPLPKDEKYGIGAFHVGLVFLMVITGLLFVTIPFGGSIAELFNEPLLARWYWLLPVYVLLGGLWLLLNNWYIRTKKFASTARYQIWLTITSTGSKVGLGYVHPSAGGLIWSSIFGNFIALVVSVIRNWKQSLRQLTNFDKSACLYVIRKYKNFPLFSLPQCLINQASGQLPIWFLIPVFGAEKIGLWNMAILLSFTPINLISRAINQVFYQNFANKLNNGLSFRHFYLRFFAFSSLILIPLFLALWFVLPQLTQFILGVEWRETGEYIRWFLPWLFLSVINSGINFMPNLFFKQKMALALEIVLFVLRLVGVIAAIITNNFIVGVAGFALASFITNLIQLIWYISLIQRYERDLAIVSPNLSE